MRGGAARWALPLATGVAVLVLGFVAARFRPDGSGVAVWWPPAGVAVAAYVVGWRRGQRVAVLASVGLGVLGAELLAGYSVVLSTCYALANLANPVVCVAVLARLVPTLRIRDAWGYAKLFLAALAAATVTAAGAAATVHLVVGDDPWPAFRAVLPSHLSAILVIAPVALLTARRSPAGRLETVVQFSTTLLVTSYVLSPWQELPLSFLCLGFLLWGAARVSTVVLWTEVVLFATIAAVFATIGGGGYQATLDAYRLAPETLATLLDTMLAGIALAVYPLALAMDVHRSSLAEVRESRELLDSVLSGAAGTAILRVDLDGTVSSWNDGAEQVFGWSAAQVCGVRSLVWLQAAPQPGDAFTRLVAPLREGAAWVDVDWECARQHAGPITAALRVTARRSSEGAIVGWVALARDVTERRQADRAMRVALERERMAVQRLEELDAVKTSFVQSVSHELRTPLTSVLGYTDLLAAEHLGPLNDQQRKMLGSVSRNGRRLLVLIEDLLMLARVEQRSFSVEAERLDLREAVQRGCDTVGPQAEAASVRLEVDLSPDPLPVIGDADQLERLTVNLLGNAVKFSPAGSVVRVVVDRQGGEAVLTVADRGMGFPEDELGRLFERFFRSSNARRAEIQGSGLGLAIVKEVVDHHEGRVDVASEEGVGTTVRARLPLQAVTPAARSSRAPTPTRPG